MINLDDFIIKTTEVIKNNKPQLNNTKYFKCFCKQCDKDRGYQTKSRYNKKPLCVKCSTNTKAHKNTLSENHWSKTNKYSPKIYITDEQIKHKRNRELEANRRYYKQYYQNNKQEIHRKRKEYLHANPCARIAQSIRTRLYQSIKSKSSFKLVGCSTKFLANYLESKFQKGMSWENYGRNGWHIDHIKPLAAFDLECEEELKKACHYSNLQPLWAKDNLKKGAKCEI